ncbi:MAG: alpha/beta fold hydrolase [Litorimonas sp.]
MKFDTPHIPPFTPPIWMRPAMVQTILASLKFRKRGSGSMEGAAREIILNCGLDEGTLNHPPRPVRLLGSYSQAQDSRALIIFLHGWEGSQESTYVVSSARQFFTKGCSVFRLNFRDHGPSHHLNEDIFLATRFAEVFAAIEQICALEPDCPVYIAGFSMGGNFALRIARQTIKTPIENLAHIFSISPVVDPWPAAPLVDQGVLISRYFLKKLKKSLQAKQAAFPHLHDFSQELSMDTVMEISQNIIPKYSGIDNLEDYFNGYRIEPSDLAACEVPVSIIMAKDDPIVPAAAIDALTSSSSCHDIRLDYGGHNGFFQSISGPTWYDDYMGSIILDEKLSG